MRARGFVPLVIIAVITALVVLGGAGYMVVKKQAEAPQQELPSPRVSPFAEFTPTPAHSPVSGACRPTGCSGQICADEGVVTTCEFRKEYACYKTATCERQSDGKCGWTMTGALQLCLFEARATPAASIAPRPLRTPTPLRISPSPSPSSLASPSPAPSPTVPTPSPTPSPGAPADTQIPYVKGFKVENLPDGRSRITVKASESLEPNSITSATAYLERTTIPSIHLDGIFEKTGDSFSLLTNVGLSHNVSYTMRVRKEVSDSAGNMLEADFSCTFTWQSATIIGCQSGLLVSVKILPDRFSPSNVVIQRGATVVFKNESGVSRWPASDDHPSHTICSAFDPLRAIESGQTYQHTFTTARTCPYHDHISPNLRGTVIVEAE